MRRTSRPLLFAALLACVLAVLPAAPALAAAPAISSFTPSAGVTGTLVTVDGSGLTGTTAVRFNGVAGTGLVVVSDTRVRARVPGAASSGPISVTTPEGTATSASAFSVVPKVTSVSPTSGHPGTVVTVSGTALSGPTAVTLAGQATSFSPVSRTSVTFTVPSGASTGRVAVTTGSGTSAEDVVFTVTAPPPPSLSINRAVGPPTSVVTLTGAGFAPYEAVDVYAGTTDVRLVAASSAGSITAASLSVPASAPPGPFWFTAVGRRSGNAAQVSFLVRTDWRMHRGSALGRGLNAYENVLNASSIDGVTRSWTARPTGTAFGNIPAGVAVGNGLVVGLLGYTNEVVALRPDGTQAWSRPLSSEFFNAPGPAIGGNVVVVRSTDGTVHAHTLSTGADCWTSPGPADTSASGSPVVVRDAVLVPGSDTLRVFALATGELRWSHTGSCANTLTTPVVGASSIAFTCRNAAGAAVRVVLRPDGALVFSSSVTTTAPTRAGALVNGSLLSLFAGALSLGGETGAGQKWSVTVPSGSYADVIAAGGLGIVCGSAGVYAHTLSRGTLAWSDPTAGCQATPAAAGGLLYVPEASRISVYEIANGNLVTHLGTHGSPGSPVVVDGAVYAAVGLTTLDKWSVPPAASLRTTGSRPSPESLQPDPTLEVS